MQKFNDGYDIDPYFMEQLLHVERYAWLSLLGEMGAVISIDGAFTAVNNQWQLVTGFEGIDLEDTYLLEYMHYEDRERAIGEMQRLTTEDISTTTFPFRFRCKNDAYKRLNWSVLYSPEHESFFARVTDASVAPQDKEAMRRAYSDALTGLKNRLFLTDNMSRMFRCDDQECTRMTILFIDLDGFKEVNDTYGHMFGDKVLREVAIRLKGVVRTEDHVVRLGGDEFLVILYGTNNRTVLERIAENMVKRIGEPVAVVDQDVFVGASIGISRYPQDSDDPDRLIEMADQAMYQVKRTGKNGFDFYDAVLETEE